MQVKWNQSLFSFADEEMAMEGGWFANITVQALCPCWTVSCLPCSLHLSQAFPQEPGPQEPRLRLCMILESSSLGSSPYSATSAV